MKDAHILLLLEKTGVGSLGPAELARIESHTAGCDECRAAYENARLAQSLLKARVMATAEPSPFFGARVMAAVRARAVVPEETVHLSLWRATATLIAPILAVIIVLLAVNLFTGYSGRPGVTPDEQGLDVGQDTASSLESVVFDETPPAQDVLSYGQVIDALFDTEEGNGNR